MLACQQTGQTKMMNTANIIGLPAKEQYVDIVILSINKLALAFSSHHCLAYVQPHRAASMAKL